MTAVADAYTASADPVLQRRGVALYRRAHRAGASLAAFNLAVTYQRWGKHHHAAAWFRRAGGIAAQIELAKAAFHGAGVRRAPATALARLAALAREERIDLSPFEREDCLLFVARAYLDGWAVPRDGQRARAHLEHAARIGSRAARGLLDDLGWAWREEPRRAARAS